MIIIPNKTDCAYWGSSSDRSARSYPNVVYAETSVGCGYSSRSGDESPDYQFVDEASSPLDWTRTVHSVAVAMKVDPTNEITHQGNEGVSTGFCLSGEPNKVC
jgi:hypothetical protein